jgi:O-6-methylguanine DNA methyltransferase
MNVSTADLKRLGEMKAPAGLADRVLAEAGIGDSYARFDTVIGTVFVAWNRNGVSAAARSRSASEFEDYFRKEVRRPLRPATPPPHLAHQVEEELSGRRTMRFDLRGLTEFEQAVLRKAREIPFGQIRPYSWVAREIGHPAAVRAVGSALANNPIPYFIPCHRVVRADGVIGNYGGGGPEAKKAMLSHEGVQVQQLAELARAGIRYQAMKTTGIYCYPTCYHGRHALDRNRVWFHDAAEAKAAGYRPCKTCRPLAV